MLIAACKPISNRTEPNMLQIRPFQMSDESAVIELWRACNLLRPWNDPHKDIQRKLGIDPELFLVGVVDEQIVATAMLGYDGHRGWIYYLGVSPEHRQFGFGRLIMDEAEKLLRSRGCPKINLQVRTSNLEAVAFYERIGYKMDEVVSLGKRLESDLPE
jgi:ribosomal protein S18 acetylase RimI-like enzyme